MFSISGAFVPVIALMTSSLMAQCGILAGVSFLSAIALCIPKSPYQLPPPVAAFSPRHKMKSKKSTENIAGGSYDPSMDVMEKKKSFEYIVELLASWEALWLIGGKVAATSYFTTYVDDTGVIAGHYVRTLYFDLHFGMYILTHLSVYLCL